MKGERGFKGLPKLLYVKDQPLCTVEGHSCYLDAMAPLRLTVLRSDIARGNVWLGLDEQNNTTVILEYLQVG